MRRLTRNYGADEWWLLLDEVGGSAVWTAGLYRNQLPFEQKSAEPPLEIGRLLAACLISKFLIEIGPNFACKFLILDF